MTSQDRREKEKGAQRFSGLPKSHSKTHSLEVCTFIWSLDIQSTHREEKSLKVEIFYVLG